MLYFKKVIVVFWTVWTLIALWTDVVGGLTQLHWLNATWAPNLNYPFLVKSLSMYSVPAWLPAVFFIGIIIWEFLASILFVHACLALQQPAIWLKRAEVAFIFSLCLWFAFYLADQLVMKFDLEANHMVQGGFMFLTFLGLYILPNENQNLKKYA